MKKFLMFLCFVAILLVTAGCGKKNQLVCSKTETEDGVKVKMDITLEFDSKDVVKNASLTYDFDSKETADTYCELFKMIEDETVKDSITCSGTKIEIKDMDAYEAEEAEDSEKMAGKTKTEILALAEEEGLTCK